MTRQPGMTIARAAAAADVGIETIRFYERRGLIEQPPRPAKGGYRRYPDATVRRIRFIRQAQDIGFSLREIAELLELRADPAADCADVRDRAAGKLVEVRGKLARIQQMERALETLIAACPGEGSARDCSILEALDEACRNREEAEP